MIIIIYTITTTYCTYIQSKTSDDFPLPETPVTTLNLCLSKKTDSITYLVTIKNYEEENIVLEDILLNNTNNEAFTYVIENAHKGEILPSQTACLRITLQRIPVVEERYWIEMLT